MSGAFFVYSFDGRLLAEYNLLGQCTRDYIYFGGQLIAEYRESQPGHYFYYASDQINSTRIVTDSTGTIVYSAAHEPYGGIQKTWPSTYDPSLKFSGKQRDAESDLDYFGARYYDHSQYRFLSPDRAIISGGARFDSQRWNLYAYCGNNPMKYVDSNGNTYIIFIKQEQKLYIYDSDNYLWGVFDASNNPSGDQPFPNGRWAFRGWTPHPGANSWDSIDSNGAISFYFGDQYYRNYCLHSGRDMDFDLAGRWYWMHATNGCIRTTRDAMTMLYFLHYIYGDPITHIIVVDKFDITVKPISEKERKQAERDAGSMWSYYNMITDYFFVFGPIPPGAQ